jgi:methionine synthase II (cobalamin-independent)
MLEQGLVTPACGLARLSPEAAGHALELTAELSQVIRKKYVL